MRHRRPRLDLHSTFETTFRHERVVVTLDGFIDNRKAQISAEFTKDGKPFRVGALTREELAALCRQAAQLAKGELNA